MYYDKTFKVDGLESIEFRIKKLNPNEHLTLAMEYMKSQSAKDLDLSKRINKEMLSLIEFNKKGKDWFPIVNDNGSARLSELESKPKILINLMIQFYSMVVEPVFLD